MSKESKFKMREELPKEIFVMPKNFFELSSAEREILKKRIEAFDNTIRIFIHPFFNSSDSLKSEHRKDLPIIMREGVKKLTNMENSKTPPLFIFEEKQNISELMMFLRNDINQSVYIIPTVEASPLPFPENGFEEKLFNTRDQKEYENESFSYIAEEFKKLGVKNILIGGMNLVMKKDSGKYEALGCVAGPIDYFSKDFKVTVSHFTYPDKKEYIENFGREKGPANLEK